MIRKMYARQFISTEKVYVHRFSVENVLLHVVTTKVTTKPPVSH